MDEKAKNYLTYCKLMNEYREKNLEQDYYQDSGAYFYDNKIFPRIWWDMDDIEYKNKLLEKAISNDVLLFELEEIIYLEEGRVNTLLWKNMSITKK